MVNLAGAVNLVRARLGRARPLAAAAVRVERLEEGSIEPAAPLFMLAGQLDRVTAGVAGHSTAAAELALARAATVSHLPVLRHVLRDCVVHPWGVEYRGGYLAKAPGLRGRLGATATGERAVAHYCMSGASHRYFGHWLTDACATALLADDPGEAILDARPDWPDTGPYARAFGVMPSPPAAFRVRELHVYEDVSQGPLKRARYATMKARLAAFAGEGRAEGPPVYLRRGATGAARPIADEDALCAALERAGFTTVDLAASGFAERFRALAAAPVVVTVDGSQACHALLAQRPGSALLTLIPADRFTMNIRGYAQALDLRFGCVVMTPDAAGYRADPGEILETIARMH